jgi:hypothetical protein
VFLLIKDDRRPCIDRRIRVIGISGDRVEGCTWGSFVSGQGSVMSSVECSVKHSVFIKGQVFLK